jgi:hypothetical protein
MSAYPEHDKLLECKAERKAIGEFIDIGLGRLFGGMALYEKVEIACECQWCLMGQADMAPIIVHNREDLDRARDGIVYEQRWMPTMRSPADVLAEYFGIDRDKIDAEKAAMLEAVRGG